MSSDVTSTRRAKNVLQSGISFFFKALFHFRRKRMQASFPCFSSLHFFSFFSWLDFETKAEFYGLNFSSFSINSHQLAPGGFFSLVYFFFLWPVILSVSEVFYYHRTFFNIFVLFYFP